MKTRIVIILLIVSLLSCEDKKGGEICTGLNLETATLTDSLDYEILNTILDSIYLDYNHIHVLQYTDSLVNIEYIISTLIDRNIDIDTSLLQNYKSRNDDYYVLENMFKQGYIYLLGAEESKCLSGWDNYYKKYPTSTGHYIFNRPGYNVDKDKAIIEYGWRAGPQTGEGYIVLLEKANNKWQIMHYFVTWVS